MFGEKLVGVSEGHGCLPRQCEVSAAGIALGHEQGAAGEAQQLASTGNALSDGVLCTHTHTHTFHNPGPTKAQAAAPPRIYIRMSDVSHALITPC